MYRSKVFYVYARCDHWDCYIRVYPYEDRWVFIEKVATERDGRRGTMKFNNSYNS